MHDSWYANQLERGLNVKSQNMLRGKDTYQLFSPSQLFDNIAVTFTTRLLLITALQTALRLLQLLLLRLIQLSRRNCNGVGCIRFEQILGVVDWTSQTAVGGRKDSRVKAKNMDLFYETATLKSIAESKPL